MFHVNPDKDIIFGAERTVKNITVIIIFVKKLNSFLSLPYRTFLFPEDGRISVQDNCRPEQYKPKQENVLPAL